MQMHNPSVYSVVLERQAIRPGVFRYNRPVKLELDTEILHSAMLLSRALPSAKYDWYAI